MKRRLKDRVTAVLATLRIPPDALSPEQRNRLAGFYAAQGWERGGRNADGEVVFTLRRP